MNNPNPLSATDRRSLLKTGALRATPIAAVAPVAALAGAGSRAELARLQDERAIEALHRKLLRRVNTQGIAGARELIAANGSCELDCCVRRIVEDSATEATLVVKPDGRSATGRHPSRVELQTEFTGNSTLEQMARLQGQGTHRHSRSGMLEIDYVKAKDGWAIAKVKLA